MCLLSTQWPAWAFGWLKGLLAVLTVCVVEVLSGSITHIVGHTRMAEVQPLTSI